MSKNKKIDFAGMRIMLSLCLAMLSVGQRVKQKKRLQISKYYHLIIFVLLLSYYYLLFKIVTI